MGMPSMPELLVVLAIVVLLFGSKKIPELAKGIGKGIKDFKKAMNEDEEANTNAPANKELAKDSESKKVEESKEATKAS